MASHRIRISWPDPRVSCRGALGCSLARITHVAQATTLRQRGPLHVSLGLGEMTDSLGNLHAHPDEPPRVGVRRLGGGRVAYMTCTPPSIKEDVIGARHEFMGMGHVERTR